MSFPDNLILLVTDLLGAVQELRSVCQNLLNFWNVYELKLMNAIVYIMISIISPKCVLKYDNVYVLNLLI